MMDEFSLNDICGISDFILTNSKRATLERINSLSRGVAKGEMRSDGYSHPVDLRVKLSIQKDKILCDFNGTSGMDKKGYKLSISLY